MITDRLVVKPAELQAKAAEVRTERSRITDALTQAKTEIESTRATWISAAADSYRTQFVRQVNSLDGILQILDRHVSDLIATADTFSTGERSLASKNESLPVVDIQR